MKNQMKRREMVGREKTKNSNKKRKIETEDDTG